MVTSDATARAALVYELLNLTFALAKRTDALVADVLTELDLTFSLADTVWQLDPNEAAPKLKQLAATLQCDPSTVTFIADRLHKKGLAARQADPANRRVKTLLLTPKGRRIRRRLIEAMTTSSPIASLSEREQRQLRGLLAKAMERAGPRQARGTQIPR